MTTTKSLYIALELGQDKWLLACATEAAEKPRLRSMPARDLNRLALEIAKAKERFGLPGDAPVCTCYEAGRDGFWLHRALTSRGIVNVIVDSSSIEVNRRSKQVKTDPVGHKKGSGVFSAPRPLFSLYHSLGLSILNQSRKSLYTSMPTAEDGHR